MNQLATNTKLIKSEAKRLGFDYVGISKADFLEEEAPRLENWLNKNSKSRGIRRQPVGLYLSIDRYADGT